MSEKPDMRAVLDHYDVTYDPDKTRQKILCPVHTETVPSCSVDLDEGWFNCHACNAKGDSWNLIMERERCDFVTAKSRAEGIARAGNGPVRKSDGPGNAGLFGRSRPEHRNGRSVPYRPGIFRDRRP